MISFYENATHIVLTGEPSEIRDMVDEMAFKPEGFYYAPSYQRFLASAGQKGWDGFIRPLTRLTETSAKALRGHKTFLLNLAKMLGFKISTKKLLPAVFGEVSIEDVPPNLIAGDFVLDDRQRECILNWVHAGVGINKVTVSGGKTAMFAGAAAFIKQRVPEAKFIYISQAERLIRQVTGEMKKFLPGWDIGQFGGGHKDFDAEDMVICTVAMLRKHFNALKSKGWFEEFMAILYDEVHHCASPSSEAVLLEIPAYFRLGASDSVKEQSKSKHNQIRGLFGPILTEIGVAPLQKEKRVAKATIYIVNHPLWTGKFRGLGRTPELDSPAHVLHEGEWLKGRYKGPVYELYERGKKAGTPKMKQVRDTVPDGDGNFGTHDEPIVIPGLHKIQLDGEIVEVPSRWCLLDRTYDRCIINFKERNKSIVEWCQHFAKRDLTTLIVCTRTLHIYILEAMIKKAVDPDKVDILFGHDGVAARDRAFKWFRETPGAILITPLVKEGVSINEIQAGIVADYVGDREVANQIIGRFIRKKFAGENRAEIVWFRDVQHAALRKGSSRVIDDLKRYYPYCFVDDVTDPASAEGRVPRIGGSSPRTPDEVSGQRPRRSRRYSADS